MAKKISTRDAQAIARKIVDGEGFDTHGSLSARTYKVSTGRMPALHRDAYHGGDKPVYTIRSYDTPIAWKRADGTWAVPEVKYSVTTGRQQNTVLYAIQLAGGEIR